MQQSGWKDVLTPDSANQGRAVFGILLALLIGFSFPTVLVGWDSFYYRDFGALAYPSLFYSRDRFWHGELPLWNPLIFSGVPFLAQWGTMVLYPLSLVYWLLPMPWSVNLFCLGHLWWGGMGMYALALRWTNRPFAASVAGVAWVFNGVTLSSLIWPNYAAALGWMPWVVATAERAWRQGGRACVVAAWTAALQMLTGVPELLVITWTIIGGLFLFDSVRPPSARDALGRLAGVILLAGGLSAAQLIPFWDLLCQSQRDRAFDIAQWMMPGWGWANLIVPLYHTRAHDQGFFFQPDQQFLLTYYLGLTPLMLAAMAALTHRQPRCRWLLVVALGSLVLALGPQGHLYTWLKSLLPQLGYARYTIKFVFGAAFAVPLLAAFTLAALPSRRNPRRLMWQLGAGWLVMAGLALLLLREAHAYPWVGDDFARTGRNAVERLACLALALVGVALAVQTRRQVRQVRQVAGTCVLGLLAFDALTHTPVQNPVVSSDLFTPGLWRTATGLTPPLLGQGRVMVTPEAERQLMRTQLADHKQNFLGKRLALGANLNLLEQIPKVDGYQPLQLRWQAEVEALLYNLPAPRVAGLLDFLGVIWLNRPDNITAWMARETAMPMITAGQQPVFSSDSETLSALTDGRFNPRAMVYLPLEARARIQAGRNTNVAIRAQRIEDQTIEVETESAAPSMLLIAQSYHPAWHARVDGQGRSLWRANHAFQAVEIPAGRHHVTLRYQDAAFRAGAILSLAALVVSLLLWRPFSSWRRSKYQQGTGDSSVG